MRARAEPVMGAGDVHNDLDQSYQSLSDRAYREIEELICTLQLRPGLALSEAALVKRVSIGRTPIREALQRLARDGLVVVVPRRGVIVSDVNVHTQLRVLEVRRVLEELMARLAAERATDEERLEFGRIASLIRKTAEDQDDIGFVRLDARFNEIFAKTARNEFLLRFMGPINALSRRFWYRYYKQAADLPLTARLHADVAEAIAVGDAGKAAGAAVRLVDYIEDFTRRTLDG